MSGRGVRPAQEPAAWNAAGRLLWQLGEPRRCARDTDREVRASLALSIALNCAEDG